MSNEFSRRQMLGMFGLAGAGALLTACAGPGTTARPTASAGTSAFSGKATGNVSFAHWRAEDKPAFDELIKKFTAAHPDITMTQDITPSADWTANGLQKLRGSAVGDAFATLRGSQFEQVVKAGVYADLTGTKAAANYQNPEAGTKNGKVLGLPLQVVFNQPVINLDAFDKANADKAPADWDSLLNTCDKLKTAGFVPIAWPGGDAGNLGQLFNSMILNHAPAEDMCAQIEQGKLKVTDSWFIDMLKQYQQLAPFFQDKSTGTLQDGARVMFAQGTAAMMATGSFDILTVRKQGAKFPIDMLFPKTVAKGKKSKYDGVYNQTFIMGVNSASKTQPAAYAWLEFMSQPENAGYYANNTAQHVGVKGVKYTDKDLSDLEPWLSKNNALAPRFQFLNLDVRKAVEGTTVAVVGGTSPEKAAEDAQKIVDQNRQS